MGDLGDFGAGISGFTQGLGQGVNLYNAIQAPKRQAALLDAAKMQPFIASYQLANTQHQAKDAELATALEQARADPQNTTLRDHVLKLTQEIDGLEAVLTKGHETLINMGLPEAQLGQMLVPGQRSSLPRTNITNIKVPGALGGRR